MKAGIIARTSAFLSGVLKPFSYYHLQPVSHIGDRLPLLSNVQYYNLRDVEANYVRPVSSRLSSRRRLRACASAAWALGLASVFTLKYLPVVSATHGETAPGLPL